MTEPATIVLWQTPACWGLPSTSPFCIKLESWLRMAGLRYEARVLQGLPRSPTGKIPYVELGDGRLLADSGVIIDTLTAERGVDLDAGLEGRERALATAVTRMLEDHLYWAVAWDRWIPAAHWAKTRVAYERAATSVRRAAPAGGGSPRLADRVLQALRAALVVSLHGRIHQWSVPRDLYEPRTLRDGSTAGSSAGAGRATDRCVLVIWLQQRWSPRGKQLESLKGGCAREKLGSVGCSLFDGGLTVT